MLNKCNSKVLKALSTAIVGSVAIGNCSTVWMMESKESEESNIVNELVVGGKNTLLNINYDRNFKINVYSFLENLEYYKNLVSQILYSVYKPKSKIEAENWLTANHANVRQIRVQDEYDLFKFIFRKIFDVKHYGLTFNFLSNDLVKTLRSALEEKSNKISKNILTLIYIHYILN